MFYYFYTLKKVNLLKKTFRVVSNSFVPETWIATCTHYLQNYKLRLKKKNSISSKNKVV